MSRLFHFAFHLSLRASWPKEMHAQRLVYEFEWRAISIGSLKAKLFLASCGMPKWILPQQINIECSSLRPPHDLWIWKVLYSKPPTPGQKSCWVRGEHYCSLWLWYSYNDCSLCYGFWSLCRSQLDKDEVYSVAELLGDLVAYRARGASHLEVVAGEYFSMQPRKDMKNRVNIFNLTGVLVWSWLFCIQRFPWWVSFRYMLGVSVKVWTKNRLFWFIEGQTHFSTS